MLESLPRVQELTISEADRLADQYPYNPTIPHCHAQATDGSFTFLCCRERAHDGPHIAWTPKGPIAAWERAAE